MATKSFQSEFTFDTNAANALLNALNSTRKVNLVNNKPVNYYRFTEPNKMKLKFDSVFQKKS
ncbi:hypothetical protein PT285_06065 [Lactobacillus sp. ESL0791]|uniref:hypothetical protein n=1 Tax=Lactobacillus sp. ESL0791 TaxID=2983234 RepID=UPI0023F8B33F|nr:hypothetical protein [Lactobacillus sp. ESL0791]MDF7638964.1 hypothetical protein [Lactobacillus sp. ESL0791]